MSNSTIKKSIISSLFLALDIKDISMNKLVLVTPIGRILGIPISEDEIDPENKNGHFLPKAIGIIANKYLDDKANSVTGNDGYILLKDVQIHSNTSIVNMPFLTVFFDQIIGVTIGNIEPN